MEVANVRVRLDKLGSDVPKKGVTPAEAVVLHVIHQLNNGGSTFGEAMDKIEVTGQAEEIASVEPDEYIPESVTPRVTEKVVEPAVGEPGDEDYIPERTVEKVISPEKKTPAHTIKGKQVMRARTNVEELRRLNHIYGGLTNKKGDKVLSLIFPDRFNPKLPEKFSDLKWTDIAYNNVDIAFTDYGTSGGRAISQS